MRGIPILVLLFTRVLRIERVRSGLDRGAAAVVALSMFADGPHHGDRPRRHRFAARPTTEAAEVIGLTATQRFRLVTVPLVLPRVVPPWINTAVEIVKATSLASLIGVIDLIYATNRPSAPPATRSPFYCHRGRDVLRHRCRPVAAGALVERHYRYLEY